MDDRRRQTPQSETTVINLVAFNDLSKHKSIAGVIYELLLAKSSLRVLSFLDVTDIDFIIIIIITSTDIVFYRTRVYQMQPRNSQNWHSSVGKYVHHNRKTAKIRFCTSLKSISISGFVDTRDTVNAD